MNCVDNNEICQQIKNFVSSFETHIGNIEKVFTEQNTRRYRKILYVSVIEGLAKSRYPNKLPKTRFVKFVRKCEDWEHRNNISLPHLVSVLERTEAKQFEPLRDYVFAELSKWGTGGPVYLDKDPNMSDIQSLWPKANGSLMKIPCLEIKIQYLQHVELLYEYRNYLVHESRQPTMAFDSEEDTNPFYESEGCYKCTVGNKVSKFRLVYPSGFLHKLSMSCLNNLKKYMLENNKNPFNSFYFGDYLLERLNDNESFPVLKPFYRSRSGFA